MAKISMYVQLTAQTYSWGEKIYLRGTPSVANVTARKPRKPIGGAKMVKVTLVIPDSIFTEPVPSIEIDVPAEAVTNIAGYAESAEDEA